jgi:hypothetical protein
LPQNAAEDQRRLSCALRAPTFDEFIRLVILRFTLEQGTNGGDSKIERVLDVIVLNRL